MSRCVREFGGAGSIVALVLAFALAGCTSVPQPAPPSKPVATPTPPPAASRPAPPSPPTPSLPTPNNSSLATPAPEVVAPRPPVTPAAPPPTTNPGGYYRDDGPPAKPPANLDAVPEPAPTVEPLHRFANNPYVVFGQRYVPERELKGTTQRGTASWYGRQFHGNRTSNGEIYDMYRLSAAHPTLPLPSFARVTNIANGRSVVVRVNDRGPFLRGRVIDLSYSAAARLGFIENGHTEVEVQSLLPRELPRVPNPNLQTPSLPAPPRAVEPPAAPLDADSIARGPAAPSAFTPPLAAQTITPRAPVLEEAGGHFVQLGAYRSPENAESVLARFIFQLTEFSDRLRIVARGGMHRVVAGPYVTRGEALAASTRIGALE